MSGTAGNWSLSILVAHSLRWSQGVSQNYRDAITSLLDGLQADLRAEHPSLHLQPRFPEAGRSGAALIETGIPPSIAILDVTDCDDEIAFLAGHIRGSHTPFVCLCRGDATAVARRLGLATDDPRMIQYEAIDDLLQQHSSLHRELAQALSQSRILEELIYELWFPRDTSTIWVVCPQIHVPGEFADRSSPDYTYLDNLGDTDALLEVMVFLSRYYPKAIIEKFSSEDLPPGHTRNNLVIIGGPGSVDEISNHVCQELMSQMHSRVSYSEDCDQMIVADGSGRRELTAELRPQAADKNRSDHFTMLKDHGYFARFANPLNESAKVVLVNGIHTAGVLGAAKVFADRRESLRNYHSVFDSAANPRSFECHFPVDVLHGTVKVPHVQPESIYTLGAIQRTAPAGGKVSNTPQPATDQRRSVTVLFIAGDRGGTQRNQIQIPREYDAIQNALRGSEYRDAISLANPVLAATHQKLIEAYRYGPAILHFAGHGDDRSLSFILDQGLLVGQTPLIAERLTSILSNFPQIVRLCVLNSCSSGPIAEHIVNSGAVEAAIGWPATVSDANAIAFSGAFYGRLGDGLSLQRSFALAADSLGITQVPVLRTGQGVNQELVYVHR